jgi:hypothetical protein
LLIKNLKKTIDIIIKCQDINIPEEVLDIANMNSELLLKEINKLLARQKEILLNIRLN